MCLLIYDICPKCLSGKPRFIDRCEHFGPQFSHCPKGTSFSFRIENECALCRQAVSPRHMGYRSHPPIYPYNPFRALPGPYPALHPSSALAFMSTQDYGQNYQQQGEIHFASFYDSRGQMLPRHMRSKSAGVFQHNGYGQNISWRPPCSPAGIGLENTTNRGSKSREELLHDNLEHLRRSNEAAYYIHPRDEAIETSFDHEDEDTMTKSTASPVDSPPFELPNPEDAYPAYRKGSLSVPPSVTLTELDYAPRRCKSCLGSPNSDCEYNFITTRKSDDLQTAAKAELCSECSAVAAPVPVTQPSQDANPTIPKTPTYPTEAAQTSQFTPTASVSMTTTTTAGIPVQRTWSQLLFARPGRPTRPSSAKPKSESSAIDETDWPSLGSCPGLSKNARKRNPSS